jgi:hypothetical protein
LGTKRDGSVRKGLESRVYAGLLPGGKILKEEPPAAKPL